MTGALLVVCTRCGRSNRLRPELLRRAGHCGACGAELPLAARPFAVDREDDLHAIVGASAIPLLIDFWAPWCGPCRSMVPELERVAVQQAGRLLVVKTDIDVDPMIGARHHITAVPTLVLFSGGREIGRHAGALPAPRMETWIDDALGVPG